MRAIGYRTVDMLVEHLTDRSAPPLRRATPAEMESRLGGPAPAAAESYEAILERLAADVLPFASRGHHPRYFAFIPFSGTWPAALGDFVASAANLYAGSWMESAGPSQVELEILGWFKEWIDYPASAGGILVSGGSAANLTALACARETLVGPMSSDVVAYVSDQAHSSLARAARNLGFRPNQVRVLPADEHFRMPPETLRQAIDRDRSEGRVPLFVCASAGATNTGAVDPLAALGEICRERGVWFHVDGAYGGFSVLTERGRSALVGLALADSVTLDPHKWLHQPYECGCLLVRQGDALPGAFSIAPDYLKDAVTERAEVNFADLGMQLSRSARALKVWISLRYFGVDAYRQAIDRSLDLAQLARRRIEASDTLELLAPASLSVACFRRRFPRAEDGMELDRLNAGLVAALEASGLGLVSSTRLRGRYAIRMCILSHTSTADDVERVLDFLERADPEPAGAGAVAGDHPRDADVRQSWLRQPGLDAETIVRLPLFASLTSSEAEFAAGLARAREAAAGEAVVEQWDTSRDFFVIVSGSIEVVVDGRPVARAGPGEFFGELASLDWGAGFGYSRQASVVAATPLRLLIFPDGALNDLVRELPSVAAAVRGVIEERLRRQS